MYQYLLFASLIFGVLASHIPVMGNAPRNCQGRGIIFNSCAALFVRQSGKTWRLLIEVWRFLVLLLFVHSMPASRHSDSTPDSKRVPLCVHDYRAFRTVQTAFHTATAVSQ